MLAQGENGNGSLLTLRTIRGNNFNPVLKIFPQERASMVLVLLRLTHKVPAPQVLQGWNSRISDVNNRPTTLLQPPAPCTKVPGLPRASARSRKCVGIPDGAWEVH